MKRQDPYAEIEKVPLFTADNMRSRGYTVRIEDDSNTSGWREVGLVSEEYLLVPNRQVRDMALEIASRTSMNWNETKTFFDGKRFVYALVAESGIQAEVQVGDVINLGMLVENSYDGSRKLAISLFVNRLACSNGMLLPQYFSRIRFKHDNASLGWEEEAKRALSILDHAEDEIQRFAEAAGCLAQTPLGSTELTYLRREALGRLPVTLWGKIIDQYLLREEPTGWGLLNAGTNVLWHTDKGTISDFGHNEYVTSALVDYAVKEMASYRRN